MEAKTFIPAHPLLRKFIQYFLFMSHMAKHGIACYTTYPNTNRCLSLYKYNTATFSSPCIIDVGSRPYTSYITGMHQKPFTVRLGCDLDKVCIIFHPGGLQPFSRTPVHELNPQGEAFLGLFGQRHVPFLEHLFELEDVRDRTLLLEHFFLNCLEKNPDQPPIAYAIKRIHETRGCIKVGYLASELGVDVSTLFRAFRRHLGINPKQFMRITRFRYALHRGLLANPGELAKVAYESDYFDQSHMIRDFGEFTRLSPKIFFNQVSNVDGNMLWMVEGRE